MENNKTYIYINIIILWCQGFGQEFFFVSAQECDSRNWDSRSNSFVRAPPLRGAAPTPLALPCPFRTSTRTRADAERDIREVDKIPHVEEEFRRFWLNLNVCSAWMIYKIGIISKRYLIMFGILRWHTLERLFLCCTFLLVRLVSCSAFIVSFLLVLLIVSCPFSCFLQIWFFCAANTILNFFDFFFLIV